MKKSIICLFIFLFSTTLYALPASKESLENLFDIRQSMLLKYTLELDSPIEKINKMIIAGAALELNKLSSKEKEAFTIFLQAKGAKIFSALMEETMPLAKKDFVDIYSQIYTQEEVDSLISYYSSPLGQKIVEKEAKGSLEIAGKYMQHVTTFFSDEQKLMQLILK